VISPVPRLATLWYSARSPNRGSPAIAHAPFAVIGSRLAGGIEPDLDGGVLGVLKDDGLVNPGTHHQKASSTFLDGAASVDVLLLEHALVANTAATADTATMAAATSWSVAASEM